MSDDVRLRPSTPADLAFITGLERREDHLAVIGQWSDLEHLAAMQSPKREHWIVEVAGVPAGYLIAFDGREASGGCYLKRILVADKGRGVGRAALTAFMEHAFGDLGAPFVWLHVREANEGAQKLYRDLGFRRFDPTATLSKSLDQLAGITRIFDRTAPAPPAAFRMLLKHGDWAGADSSGEH